MTLKYEATLDNMTSIDLPEEFEQTALVIDGAGYCITIHVPVGHTIESMKIYFFFY